MKKYWPYILTFLITAALVVMVVRNINTNKKLKAIEQQLKQADSIIISEKAKQSIYINQIKIDSIAYEKQKQHIQDLRNRYPSDMLIDSLFRAGQNIN